MRESTNRAKRIDQLKEIVKKITESGKQAVEKKLVAQLAIQWNLSVRKVKEYLNLLVDAEIFTKTKDGIQYKQAVA